MEKDQIKEINQKLDLLLENVNQQRLKSEMIEDLISDVAIIGKDAFENSVEKLEEQGVELDGDALQLMFFKMLKNIDNFSMILNMFESMVDLSKDLGPIVKQTGYDVIDKFTELDKKGYFEFFSEALKIIDNIVLHYTVEDVRMLADNIVTILDTFKNLTQPDMIKAIDNALNIFKNLDTTNVPEYSIWKVMKELNTPEMKRGLGFVLTFMKSLTPVDEKAK
ncbi:MAG: DUF1641 domain-containing protein [Bacteroidales bacterium]|nr:DUF1641 domain-containing protein [Bacteroidales bacterium]